LKIAKIKLAKKIGAEEGKQCEAILGREGQRMLHELVGRGQVILEEIRNWLAAGILA
jgi:hypothetical protein